MNCGPQEAALADAEAQMERLSEAAGMAEARAALGEVGGATARDQLLRLNADFENFRRRTVRVPIRKYCI